MKLAEDRHRCPSPFQVGDKVLISHKVLQMPDVTYRKLQHRYYGPYPVLELRGENAVVVELGSGKFQCFKSEALERRPRGLPWSC